MILLASSKGRVLVWKCRLQLLPKHMTLMCAVARGWPGLERDILSAAFEARSSGDSKQQKVSSCLPFRQGCKPSLSFCTTDVGAVNVSDPSDEYIAAGSLLEALQSLQRVRDC